MIRFVEQWSLDTGAARGLGSGHRLGSLSIIIS